MATVFADKFKQWVVDAIDGATRGALTDMKFIGWGTGAGTAGVTDTTLFTEDSAGTPAYGRVTGVMSQTTTGGVTGDTYQLVGTITSNGTKTITNAGYFDASTSGNLGVKGDFTGIPLVLNDSIQFTFTLLVTQ